MFENNVKDRIFPDNLYYDVTDEEPIGEMPSDYYATIMYLVHRFPAKKAEMILSRYRDGLSFRKIGDIFELTGARAESIISDCIESMRQDRSMLMDGIEETMNHCKTFPVARVSSTVESEPPTTFGEYEGISVAELDFTTRTMNAFLRSDIGTVADIMRMGNDIWSLPHLGEKSLNEIVIKLAEIGVDVKKYFNRVIIAFKIDLTTGK